MPSAAVTNTLSNLSNPANLSALDTNFSDLTTFLGITAQTWVTATVVPSFNSTNAQQATATVATTFVNPGNQHRNLASVKAWGVFDFSNASLNATFAPFLSYGISEMRGTAGLNVRATLSEPLGSSYYPLLVSGDVANFYYWGFMDGTATLGFSNQHVVSGGVTATGMVTFMIMGPG